ncbi:hypothetical protein [Microbulbifer sp. M83]|uniref:F0F1 ATP synthase subunit epsilon n=1 Tax=unclassified Microbulbifer TaxID=2619833 RepID=UPI002FE26B75
MNSFTLELLSATELRKVEGVISFVGEDASGSFGILAGHMRCITSLVFGLSRFRCIDGEWHYLALPGGLLYFLDNRLQVCTRHFMVDRDYERISGLLQEQLLEEERALQDMKESLRRLEESLLKRLWESGHRQILQE